MDRGNNNSRSPLIRARSETWARNSNTSHANNRENKNRRPGWGSRSFRDNTEQWNQSQREQDATAWRRYHNEQLGYDQWPQNWRDYNPQYNAYNGNIQQQNNHNQNQQQNPHIPGEFQHDNGQNTSALQEEMRKFRDQMQVLQEENARMKAQLKASERIARGMRPERRADIEKYKLSSLLPTPSDTQQKALEEGKIPSLTQTKALVREEVEAIRTDALKITAEGVKIERQKEKLTSHIDIMYLALVAVALAITHTPKLVSDTSAIYDLMQWFIKLCEQCKRHTPATIQRIDADHRKAYPIYDTLAALGTFKTEMIQKQITTGESYVPDHTCVECNQSKSLCACARNQQKKSEPCFAYNKGECTNPCPQGRIHDPAAKAPAKSA